MAFQGGYYLFKEPIVRGYGPNAHTAKDLSKLSEYTVEAVNLIQETLWQVNPFVMDTVNALSAGGKDVIVDGETFLIIERPYNPREHKFDPKTNMPFVSGFRWPTEQWAVMTKEQKAQIRTSVAEEMSSYEENLGIWRATKRLINTANEMSQFEKFYFPHNMDFRTRIYPIPTDLNPQSNDLSKGLLRFTRGKRLGTDGVFWLGFTVASHWGEDKLSPKDRHLYAKKMLIETDIEAWVDDPVNNRGWLKADAPFQFLASAYEWVWAHRLADPESYISFLPGNLDGSCNGAQHLSILSRDLVGATATNCRAGLKRYDLYQQIADIVWEKLQADAEAGVPEALRWLVKMSDPATRRKVVKRAVMTVPYGVTEYGVADFMIKDKHVTDGNNGVSKWDQAKYMRDLIMSSINKTLDKGRLLQFWFRDCAVLCAKHGKPMQWDTPAGSKVTQAYRNVIEKRIDAYNTKFVVYAEPDADEEDEEFLERLGMDEQKMGTAAPPNVIHSCDASHLQITVCRMADAGIRDFSMIHDSFGCHFADMGLMRDILRQSIVDMYSDDYLKRWKESVERYSGLTMPEPPATGEFDITEILNSEFFFS